MYRNILRKIIVCFVLGGAALAAVPGLYAAALSLSASVNTNTVAIDDRLVLQVNVSGGGANLPKPAIPTMTAFTVYSAGTSQNMSFINGSFSSSLSYQYVLVPKTTGKFTIPPITLHYEGTVYQTQAIPVEVMAASPAAPRAAAAPQDTNAGEQSRDGKSVFITATIDKPAAYVNEQVTYTFRFYTRRRLTSNPQLSPPDLSGFWTDDTPPRNFTAVINGQHYTVTEVKTLLFPTRPGRFTLGPATLQCNVDDFNADDPFSDDFFRSFFSGGRTHVLRTNALSVNVLPLPDGKPRDFGGAVGQFRVTAHLDRDAVQTNEPVTLNITISGTGNIKTLTAPVLPVGPDFRKYETVSSHNISKDGEILKGSKTFKTVIVPQVPGKKTIAPIVFSYFDPARKSYTTVTTPALTLEVAPGPQSAVSAPLPATPGDITVINRDIRYLKNPGVWTTFGGLLYRRGWFIAMNVVPLFAFGLALIYRLRQDKLNNDVAYARRRKASAAARKYLKNAQRLLAGGTPPAFAAAVARALLEYIAHKANVSADGLTSAAISGILQGRGVAAGTINGVKEILDECDMVRFAPTSVTAASMRSIFERTQELIGSLEKECK